MARPMELGIMAYQVIPKMPEATIKTGRRNNISYIRINPIAASSSRYHVYVTNLSWILISGYCSRVYI